MSQIWPYLFAWIPATWRVPILGAVAIIAILFVFKLVKFILDSIPFI